MKKAISLLLTLVLVLSVFVGCKGKDSDNTDGTKIDKNKTQLYVSIYNGGFGSDWINKVIKDFESENPTVQVVLLKNKDEYNVILGQLQSNSARADVYFSDNVKLQELISLDLIADITDIVTTPFEKDASGKDISIKDKMRESFIPYVSNDNKFYALPFIDGVSGVVYDHDLFAEKGFLNYGNGPDGVAGTYDDGLPATMDQFQQLLGRMVNSGVYPFIWTGQYDFYLDFLMNPLWAQYEGLDNYNLNFTYDGTDSVLGSITPQNANKLWNQEGRLKSLEFVEMIADNSSYYSPDAPKTSTSHVGAQSKFILSSRTDSPIGMIVEGAWWENEARGTFYQADGEENYGSRDFRFLPFPKMEGQKSDKSMLYSMTDETAVFIKKNTQKMDLAKKFVQYTTSEKALKTFTLQTNGIRPYKYTLNDDEYKTLTKFGQNTWTMYNDVEHIGIVYKLSNNPILTMTSEVNRWRSEIGGTNYTSPMRSFISKKELTAKQYFDGCKDYYNDARWAEIYKRVY